MKIRKYILALLFTSFYGVNSFSTTITVQNTNDSGTGSLRNAISSASSGDSILFASSLSGGTITLTSGELAINNSLYIIASADSITISGNNTSRIFNVGSTGYLFGKYLKCINGYSNDTGGGIYTQGGLELEDCRITNNDALSGGGIGCANWNNNLTLRRSKVDGNVAHSTAGGIRATSYVWIEDCIIDNNVNASPSGSINGGGITCYSGDVNIYNSIISRNVTGVYSQALGGGICFIFNVDFHIENCLFKDNQAIVNDTVNSGAYGGGLYVQHAGMGVIINSTFSGNECIAVSAQGGAMSLGGYTSGGDTSFLFLENLTIANNYCEGLTSYGRGGGVASTFSADSLLQHTFKNCIVADNIVDGAIAGIGPDIYGVIRSGGSNIIGTTSSTTFEPSPQPSDQLDVDPLLMALADNGGNMRTHAVACGSPAIDSGQVTSTTTDQRGFNRVYGGAIDIGAFEAQASIADAGMDTLLGCPSTAVVLNATTFTPSDSVNWYLNGTIVQTNSTTYNYNMASSSDQIVMEVFDPSRCFSQNDTLVGIPTPIPDIQVVSTDTAVCEGASVIFTTSGLYNGSYVWDNGVIENTLFTPTATTTYTVVGTDACTRNDTLSIEVIVYDNPSITYTQVDATNNDGSIDITVSGGTAPYLFDWSNDGTGDQDDAEDLSSLMDGSYSVVVYDSNGCSATESMVINKLLAIENGLFSGMKIYPNPVISDHLYITIPHYKKEMHYSILDIMGSSVAFGKLSQIANEINMANLESGVYFLEVSDENQKWVNRIVKQ